MTESITEREWLAEETELLCRVLMFRRGLGEYNLSHLHGQERWNTNDDKWNELEADIESHLKSKGIDVNHMTNFIQRKGK